MKNQAKSNLRSFFAIQCLFLFLFLFSCKEKHINVAEQKIVSKPEEINPRAEDVIRGTLDDILNNSSNISDSFRIRNAAMLKLLYEENSFRPLWSGDGRFYKPADSLILLIDSSAQFGFFPEDYYSSRIRNIYNLLLTDTAKETRLDVSKWAYADLLLTSSFVQLVKDLKIGRILPDSIVRKDSSLSKDFFAAQLSKFGDAEIYSFASQLEPSNPDYHQLKEGLGNFLEKANLKTFTWIATKDSLQLSKLVYKRLTEEDSLQLAKTDSPDSLAIADAIKKYQKYKKLKTDGKISASLIGKLNDTDKERFIRIGINLDRYKSQPFLKQPYIWVNIPSYNLQVRDSDTVVLQSRIVVGKPETRTPLITSAISDMITYPKWHIPESIIKKEILPGLKKDPGYTLRKGYTLIDSKGNEVDPYTVKWSKYSSSIPYQVVQGSGDDNALGVLKFNFPNKFAVYLHDTNQRSLFSRSSRALSHGCVRVQSWMDLAKFILRNDSLQAAKTIPLDTLNNWLGRKEKHVIPVRKKIPLYIRYFTCEGKEGKVVFYEDIYGEDRSLRDRIFTNK